MLLSRVYIDFSGFFILFQCSLCFRKKYSIVNKLFIYLKNIILYILKHFLLLNVLSIMIDINVLTYSIDRKKCILAPSYSLLVSDIA